MNMRQRRMLGAIALAVVVVVLWPPVELKAGPAETTIDFVPLFSHFEGSIHYLLLIAEILSLCLIGMIAHRMLDDDR